jgi:hypothetical protein
VTDEAVRRKLAHIVFLYDRLANGADLIAERRTPRLAELGSPYLAFRAAYIDPAECASVPTNLKFPQYC